MIENVIISIIGIGIVFTFICAVYDDKHKSRPY